MAEVKERNLAGGKTEKSLEEIKEGMFTRLE